MGKFDNMDYRQDGVSTYTHAFPDRCPAIGYRFFPATPVTNVDASVRSQAKATPFRPTLKSLGCDRARPHVAYCR